ncbi:MAG: DNA alkylation repair protein [Candidatus Midichloria mitochondrii]|uniref:DNA alkylation repair protein n=1 Tax=Candidatus Midichloria mitochondrii TaxID=234827 RepID=UPI00031413FD|nr:DNA alkylation repair protein [Candidatus Midichloria mitochondrii]MDJ1255930.1 DNA alkylation repair protein [Candidatus Midichloria mitochondrii]MDJ1298530.1 DNA alkylation repair protein [Candidatus Midichloria mitochondrii]MDJ1312712.1 DNA alkylation repair protein [Candidatus Midichloria mitochondrii]MDJ1583251.1 DNA alkylation repair protein [Candidatus Midichloria mitochondrii]
MVNIDHIRAVTASHATPPSFRAKAFFKIGSGHYAEGGEFIGVTVPNLRTRSLKISLILA